METLPEEIVVTIPQQEYNSDKYIARRGHTRCYLEQALDEAGYGGSSVSMGGFTRFFETYYSPKTEFSANFLRDNIHLGPVTVTLIKQEPEI